MMFGQRQLFVLGIVLSVSVGVTHGADNKAEVWYSLEHEYEKVIGGKEIEHLDYLGFIPALAGGHAGVGAYLAELGVSILRETGNEIAKETIFELLAGRRENTVVGGKPVYVGIATYKHWTHERYPKIDKLNISWGTIKVPRPNTHQFYIAIGRRGALQPQPQPWDNSA